MRNRRTGSQCSCHQRSLRNLFRCCAGSNSVASVDLQAIRALRRQSHTNRDQFLILLRHHTIFQRCFVKGPKSVHRLRSTAAQSLQLLQIRLVVHSFFSFFTKSFACSSRVRIQSPLQQTTLSMPLLFSTKTISSLASEKQRESHGLPLHHSPCPS